MYCMKTYTAGLTIEVEKMYSAKFGRNKRANHINPTAEKVQKYNYKLAEDKLRRLVNTNFKYKDLHIVLTYKKDKRPLAQKSAKIIKKVLTKVRKKYKEQGKELKYILVTGYKNKDGSEFEDLTHNETALHHHILANAIDISVWIEAWEEYGRAWFFPLDRRGDYSELSNYFIGHTKNIFRDDDCPVHQRYSCSRNLKKPKMIKKTVNAESWRKEPKPLNGYFLDKSSIRIGVSEVTGYPYQFYRMIRIC